MLPVLLIEGETLGEVWMKAVETVWKKGCDIRTEYGGLSKDATVVINVKKPFLEPRAHRADYVTYMCCVLKKDYPEEILNGRLDHKIGENLHYTYHDRLFKYRAIEGSEPINQIEWIVEKLKKSSFSRRAQGITWQPARGDLDTDSPPCLQRIWGRVINNKLVIQTTWRSRDLFHAWGSNAYGLTELQKKMAEDIGVEVGQYVDFSNSLHIYEKDYKELQTVLETLANKEKQK